LSPDKIKPPHGTAPSVFVPVCESSTLKLYSTENVAPLVVSEKIAPFAAACPVE
jgi:hypothetical protein